MHRCILRTGYTGCGHAYALPSQARPTRAEISGRFRFVDELAHEHGLAGYQVLQNAGGNPADTLGFAAIVAEREFIEVGLQVLLAHGAVMRAQEPALQVRDCPMAILQGVILPLLLARLHRLLVRPLAQAAGVVAGEAVSHNPGLLCHLGLDEALDRSFVIVLRMCQTHTAALLDANQNDRLLRAFSTDEPFVELDHGGERFAIRTHQRAAQFVQPRPRRFVGAEPHDPLQVLGGNSVTMHADFENGAEPRLERFTCAGQQSARCQTALMTAAGALVKRAIAQRPYLLAAATLANHVAVPARIDPIRAAGFLVWKPLLKLQRRARKGSRQIVLLQRAHGLSPCYTQDNHELAGLTGIGMVRAGSATGA